jgi:hypothetical protein
MSRKPHSIHYIYKTTCNITKRFYIGVHSTSILEDGYLGSGTVLRRSIRKYGAENHTKEILEYLPSRDELMQREKEIVNLVLLEDFNCMNLQPGGGGGRKPGFFLSDETKKKLSAAATGRIFTDDEKKKMSESAKKPKSEEHRNNISNSMKGIKRSEEFKENLRNKYKNKKRNKDGTWILEN